MQVLKINKMTPVFPRTNPIRSILISNMMNKITYSMSFNLNGRKQQIGSK